MMKLILFVLFSGFIFVQSKITATNKTSLIKAGDPFTLQCDDPSAKWDLNGRIIVNCENCSSSTCDIDEAYKNRTTAFCKQGYSVLHFNSTQIGDKGSLKCPASETYPFILFVGKYNTTHLYSENKYPFALNQNNYTLVCNKEQDEIILWFNEEGKTLSYFNKNCSVLLSMYNKTRFDITCNASQNKGRFHIKQVSLSQDGNIICCGNPKFLYLFRLTVNVPVTSVSIQIQSQDLLEDKDGIFVCKVEESKPEASFQWIIAYQNGSLQEIQQNSSISKTAKGKLWQTNSTLTLKLNRDYKKIRCKARIENMPWTNSGYQLLDIKYPPNKVTVSQSSYLEGETAYLICEASGGNPEVYNYTWSPGNYPHVNVIKINLTRAMNKKAFTCFVHHKCKGDNPLSSTINLDVEYPPEITIHHKVSKLQEKAEIICTAQASPNYIQYKMIQNWGNKVKRVITAKQKNFQNFLYEDLGTWICQASNDVPYKSYYTNKSVEIKLNVAPHFEGNKNEAAVVGYEKTLKICFYCYPDAMDVKWYKGNEEMPFDRISYISAEDGLFPFPGKCSILKLNITKKIVQTYSLKVMNPVGERTFELTLETVIPTEPLISIIVSSVIAVIVILIIIGGIVYFKFQRSPEKTQDNTIPTINLRVSRGPENENESQYDEIPNRLSVKGQQDRTEPYYIDLSSRSPVKGKNNESDPAYLTVTNRSPVKGQQDGTEPPYIDVVNRTSVNGHLAYKNLMN